MDLRICCINDPQKAIKQLDFITARTSGDSQRKAIDTVELILEDVKKNGDSAIIEYTKRFDGFTANPLNVGSKQLSAAWDKTPRSLKKALETAYQRIKDFHQLQIPKDITVEGVYGERLGRRWRPVQKAGIYVPGGRAAYPSTVLMNAVPALVAGVEELIMVTPAGNDGCINQTVLAAAHLVGIKKLFRIGGAQAIAAMAYGTESIPKVDVISGPGNLYVTLAKKLVYGKVGIDSLAGPSEVLIIADHTAKIEQIATDLLAQAEHDPLAAAILITTEKDLADAIQAEIKTQLANHPREEVCRKSLQNWGLIIICKDLKECAELSDQFAPEHLELLVENPNDLAKIIKNAGAIFLGPWTPEAIGDYLAGPNHTLPTSGTARFSGALGVETFMKNTSMIEFTKNALKNTQDDVISLANSEGLHSHAESIKIRSSNSLATD
tara:strand:- start:9084 stop:10397 length:1314 start_codon:yes stop_codon:yes gene_type:complete